MKDDDPVRDWLEALRDGEHDWDTEDPEVEWDRPTHWPWVVGGILALIWLIWAVVT